VSKNWRRILKVNGPRGRQVFDALPELPEFRSALYIGANAKRFHLYGLFPADGLYVLEVFPEYCEQLRADRRRPVAGVFCGDVRGIDSNDGVRALAPFDVVCWWHGPEHLTKQDAAPLLKPAGSLERIAGRAVLLGMPWGVHRQEPSDGNPCQAHRSAWSPVDLERWGYETAVLGRPHKGHLTAWKRVTRSEKEGET